jgi:hypothetical protein
MILVAFVGSARAWRLVWREQLVWLSALLEQNDWRSAACLDGTRDDVGRLRPIGCSAVAWAADPLVAAVTALRPALAGVAAADMHRHAQLGATDRPVRPQREIDDALCELTVAHRGRDGGEVEGARRQTRRGELQAAEAPRPQGRRLHV